MDNAWKRKFDKSHNEVNWANSFMNSKYGLNEFDRHKEGRRGLIEGLLRFGGDRVLLPAYEPDLAKLLEYGRFLSPDGLVLRSGLPNQCHRNAARLWEARGHRLFTGYYLCEDSLWRQHSWCVTKRKPLRVIETTIPATAYFGYELQGDEAKYFAEIN